MNKPYEEMTDAELSEEFAVKVAGWKRGGMVDMDETPLGWTKPSEKGAFWWTALNPDFATSADAVMPWLEKTFFVFTYHPQSKHGCGRIYADERPDFSQLIEGNGTFARAACIALLKAKETP